MSALSDFPQIFTNPYDQIRCWQYSWEREGSMECNLDRSNSIVVQLRPLCFPGFLKFPRWLLTLFEIICTLNERESRWKINLCSKSRAKELDDVKSIVFLNIWIVEIWFQIFRFSPKKNCHMKKAIKNTI